MSAEFSGQFSMWLIVGYVDRSWAMWTGRGLCGQVVDYVDRSWAMWLIVDYVADR